MATCLRYLKGISVIKYQTTWFYEAKLFCCCAYCAATCRKCDWACCEHYRNHVDPKVIDKSTAAFLLCQNIVRNMKQNQLKDYLRDKIKVLMQSSLQTKHNYVHLRYIIGEGLNQLIVCKKVCFVIIILTFIIIFIIIIFIIN